MFEERWRALRERNLGFLGTGWVRVISIPYSQNLGNIQILPDYLLSMKNWVLPGIFGSGRVGYPLSNAYGHP